MGFWRSLKGRFKRTVNDFRARKIRKKRSTGNDLSHTLREFVYLDSTSLKSLLISQNETLPSGTTRRISESEGAEIAANLSVGNQWIAEAGVNPKVSSNSSTDITTTRVADIQTLFKEFAELPGIKRWTDENIQECNRFFRGELIELEVIIEPEPIYELMSLTTEFSQLARTAPEIMGGEGTLNSVNQIQPVMQMLDQLMAGLIPIKGRVVDYVVVLNNESRQIIKKSELSQKELAQSQPLYIVEVTESNRYWRDHRRVIFSKAQYTVMARISRTDLQREWSPLKVADQFYDLAPDFKTKLQQVRLPKAGQEELPNQATSLHESTFLKVLSTFKEGLVEIYEAEWTEELESLFAELIIHPKISASSVQNQMEAFGVVQQFFIDHVSKRQDISAEKVSELRHSSRKKWGFELMPTNTLVEVETGKTDSVSESNEWFIDSEIIAIYW